MPVPPALKLFILLDSGSRKFDLRVLGHRTTRFSGPAHPHCSVSSRMPGPDIGVGTLLSVYVSGITATAQENPPANVALV
jgi:hypothetical protein